MPITREETGFGTSDSGESTARVPGAPVCTSNASGSATFTFSDNGNGDTVTYAIYVTVGTVPRGYIKADGTDNGATEVWQTLADWGSVTITGLSDFTAYNTKVKAKSELGVETAFSAETALNSLPDVDYGVESDNLERLVSGGNTIIDETLGVVPSGNAVTAAEASQTTNTEYYGEITFTYTLKNNGAENSSISIEFSEDYDPDNPDVANWYTATEGATGDGLTALETSIEGIEHTVSWDSYTDAGTSELQTDVYFRITPIDEDSAAGIVVISSVFGVNNRPAQIVIENGDGYTYDKDTTPEFIGIIPPLRGGTKCFPYLKIYESDGTTLVQENISAQNIAGWYYETAPDTWVAMTVAGIPSTAIDGTNRVKYVVQTALTTGNYIIKGASGESRDRG